MELDTELIKSSIEGLLINSNLPDELKTFSSKILRIKKEKKHYSIFFVNTLLFRIAERKTAIRFEFRSIYNDYFNDVITRDKQGWVVVEVAKLIELEKYRKELLEILNFEFSCVQGEPFGCCSQYVECSDKKKCVKTDFLVSLACLYRLNLLQNKIFYGVNKNV